MDSLATSNGFSAQRLYFQERDGNDQRKMQTQKLRVNVSLEVQIEQEFLRIRAVNSKQFIKFKFSFPGMFYKLISMCTETFYDNIQF